MQLFEWSALEGKCLVHVTLLTHSRIRVHMRYWRTEPVFWDSLPLARIRLSFLFWFLVQTVAHFQQRLFHDWIAANVVVQNSIGCFSTKKIIFQKCTMFILRNGIYNNRSFSTSINLLNRVQIKIKMDVRSILKQIWCSINAS